MRLGAGCIEAVVGVPSTPSRTRCSSRFHGPSSVIGTTLTDWYDPYMCQEPKALRIIINYGLTVDGVIASG